MQSMLVDSASSRFIFCLRRDYVLVSTWIYLLDRLNTRPLYMSSFRTFTKSKQLSNILPSL